MANPALSGYALREAVPAGSGKIDAMDIAGRRGAPLPTFYDAVGGEETFRRLVDRFYEGVASDPPLRAIYPEEDLGPAAERLTLFLMQYWGGPRTYSETRGHPRLRMRHHPFAVTPIQRDRWLTHMRVAVEELELDEPYATMLWDY